MSDFLAERRLSIAELADEAEHLNDLLNEKRLTLAELAQRENVNICTTWRWAKRGAKGCVLETFSVGAKRYTTVEAFRRFSARCTAVALGQASPAARTNRQRNASLRQAEAELAAAGI